MEQPKPPLSTDTETPVSNTKSEPDLHPSLLTLFRIFLLAGGLSFGGGAVAYLREYLVREEGWLDDEGFLGAMEISETLPGLNAVNMAIIMGDNLRGIAGAAVSVVGMLLPGSIVVMVLGILYQSNHDNPDVKRFLLGIAAAAVGLLSAVTLQIGRRQFRQLPDIAIIMGDNLRGIAGAAVSVIGMLLPGSVVVMVLGILYQSNHDNPDVKRFLLGIAAAAVGLLSAVTLQIGRRQFRQLPDIAIIAVTFFAVSFLKIQLFVVLLGIGPISVWLYRPHVSKPRAEDEHLPFHRGPHHHWFRH